MSRILAPVVTVCQTIFCNQLPPCINFSVTRIVSRNSVDYSVYRSVSYPSVSILYYPNLAGQPLHKRGRDWSTSHCGFVSICQEFLGVLTTHDAHRHTVPPVPSTSCCACMQPRCIALYGMHGIVQPEQRRKTSRFITISIKLLVTHCSACPLLTLQHKLMMRS